MAMARCPKTNLTAEECTCGRCTYLRKQFELLKEDVEMRLLKEDVERRLEGKPAKGLQSEELAGGYALWSPESDKPPTAFFADRPSAIRAAHAMARKYEGSRFFVVKLVGVAQVSQVTYSDFDKDGK